MKVEKAVSILNKKFPGKKIRAALDYDALWYVFSLQEAPDESPLASVYYAVNKQTGIVRSFFPNADLKKFIDASKNRVIKIT